MMNQIKVFFETNVILGAVQDDLLTSDSYLKTYVDNGLIQRPERYISSKELIDFIINDNRGVVEPFVSYMVKREIRKLLEKEPLQNKIIGKLRIESKIKGLSDDDKKIFELILYKIFFIKLPSKILDLLDKFSSVSVNEIHIEDVRDDLFQRVFRPLLQRHKYLKAYFKLSGEKKGVLERDNYYEEYIGLSRGLDAFIKFRDYKRINDLVIISEAICIYNKMRSELKSLPEFYFLSCDHLFIPFRPHPDSKEVFFKINSLIKKEFKINVVAPRYFLEAVLKR